MKTEELTLEKLREMLGDIFFGKDKELTYDKLRERILGGYLYQIGGGDKQEGKRQIVAYTGKGGALSMLDALEEQGLHPALAGRAIQVKTDYGMVDILDIKIKKVEI